MPQRSIDAVHRFVEAGRPADAIALLTQRIADDDPEALFLMGLWRLVGSVVARDLTAARELLGRARAGGHTEAALFEIALTANGSGAAADWRRAHELAKQAAPRSDEARTQLSLLRSMSLGNDGYPTISPASNVLTADGSVRYFPGFATAAECAHVTGSVAGILQPASVIDPATGRLVRNPIRTSDAAVVGPTREDIVLRAINLRIAAASETDVAQGEALTILRYAPGQEFRLHMDAIAGAGNQRIATMLLYLNDDFTGGETVFPDLGLTVRPKRGDALLFRNVDARGHGDARMRHAGNPVRSGTKWLATRWIRARPFSPWTGPDRPV